MNDRRLFLDDSPGERRGVVCLNGRPERLLIERGDDLETQKLAARVVARVRRTERALRSAFLDLGSGPDGVLPISDPNCVPSEGAWLEVEVVVPSRRGKGPVMRALGEASGPVRLLAAGPTVEAQLKAFSPSSPIEAGPVAREVADLAQETALQIEHSLPSGGRLFIEETQALTAVDVDIASGAWGDGSRSASRINQQAVAWAARLLRLKGLGGLVAIDLAGKGHDGPRLTAVAKAAFAADGPSVSIGPISRFGIFELSLPRVARPQSDLLLGADGRPSDAATAFSLLRRLEGAAGPGMRVEGFCHPDIAEIALRFAPELAARIGPRFTITGERARRRDEIEVVAR